MVESKKRYFASVADRGDGLRAGEIPAVTTLTTGMKQCRENLKLETQQNHPEIHIDYPDGVRFANHYGELSAYDAAGDRIPKDTIVEEQWRATRVIAYYGSADAAVRAFERDPSTFEQIADVDITGRPTVAFIQEQMETGGGIKVSHHATAVPGFAYEVEPLDEQRLVDIKAPFSDQPQQVQKALSGLLEDDVLESIKSGESSIMSGLSDLVDSHGNGFKDTKNPAIMLMRQAGLQGMKHHGTVTAFVGDRLAIKRTEQLVTETTGHEFEHRLLKGLESLEKTNLKLYSAKAEAYLRSAYPAVREKAYETVNFKMLQDHMWDSVKRETPQVIGSALRNPTFDAPEMVYAIHERRPDARKEIEAQVQMPGFPRIVHKHQGPPRHKEGTRPGSLANDAQAPTPEMKGPRC